MVIWSACAGPDLGAALNTQRKNRQGKLSHERERIARLAKRRDFLRQRIKESAANSYDVAEESALRWAIDVLEQRARYIRLMRRLRTFMQSTGRRPDRVSGP
jgi:hypothetical protein